jgi:hypothetical protein
MGWLHFLQMAAERDHLTFIAGFFQAAFLQDKILATI